MNDGSSLYIRDRDDHSAAQRATDYANSNRLNLIDITIMKDYYPHNIESVMALPDEILPTPFYSEVLDEWSGGWSLPYNYACIIRSKDVSGKVQEFAYKSQTYATAKIAKLSQTATELLIITEDYVHSISIDD
jgi:hypothetical protein